MSFEDKILNTQALQDNKNGGEKRTTPADSTILKIVLKALTVVINRFTRGPSKIYFNYHIRQVEKLLEVLVQFERLEPVQEGISNIEQNLKSYIDKSQAMVNVEKDIPPPVSGGQFFVLIILQNDPTFVKEYNKFIDQYMTNIQRSINHANEIRTEGKNIEQNLPQDVDKITKAIDAIPEGQLSTVMKQRLKNRLEGLLTLELDKIRQARSGVDDVLNKLEKRRTTAMKARLREESSISIPLR